MKKLLIFSLLAFAIGMTSCGDDGTPPVITISSPSNGQAFAPGDVVDVKGTVTDDVEIVSINIAIDGGLLASMPLTLTGGGTDPITSASMDNVNVTLDAATPAGDYKLTVTATDDEGTVGEESVDFKVE